MCSHVIQPDRTLINLQLNLSRFFSDTGFCLVTRNTYPVLKTDTRHGLHPPSPILALHRGIDRKCPDVQKPDTQEFLTYSSSKSVVKHDVKVRDQPVDQTLLKQNPMVWMKKKVCGRCLLQSRMHVSSKHVTPEQDSRLTGKRKWSVRYGRLGYKNLSGVCD